MVSSTTCHPYIHLPFHITHPSTLLSSTPHQSSMLLSSTVALLSLLYGVARFPWGARHSHGAPLLVSLSPPLPLTRARSAPLRASSGVAESHFSSSLPPRSILDWRLRCSMLLDCAENVSGGHLGAQECTGSGGLQLCNSCCHWNPWGRAGRSAW